MSRDQCCIVVLDGKVMGVFSSAEKAWRWVQEEKGFTAYDREECELQYWNIE